MAVCTLCASGPPAVAGSEATLELFVGHPDELALEALHFVVDGEERPITLPSGAEVPSPVYRGSVAPGAHDLAVEAIYRGRSAIFTYVEGYRFRIRGRGKLEVVAEEVVRIQSRVLSRKGLTVQWHEKPYLSLTAVTSQSVQQIDAEPPVPSEPTAEAAPPRAALAAESQPPVAAVPVLVPVPCALETVHFEFAEAELGEGARAALDRFVACLGGTSAAVLLEGHCDVRGPEEYNQWLGAERARSAARHLQERGVAAGRISVRSYGKSRPLCTAAGPECAARNRRVEAVLQE